MPSTTQPITRREQIELDELLGDIYRGIETLPDKSSEGGGFVTARSYDIVKTDSRNSNRSSQPTARVIGRAHIREYELPESSPLVQSHKREVASLLRQQQDPYVGNKLQLQSSPNSNSNSATKYRGGVSNPTGATHSQGGNQQQSLAAFLNENPVVGSATPEHNKRRVRIADPPSRTGNYTTNSNHNDDDDDYDYPAQDYYNDESASLSPQQAAFTDRQSKQKKHRQQAGNNAKERVKYVNTNKFLYHQERNPDDEPLDNLSVDLERENILNPNQLDDNNDDDIDGVTRVEYYHTSWLDRQLGRASKRRSSKELNERQVKEKAMIEELKRNLKNGAITLRQSFKGKKSNNNSSKSQQQHNKSEDIFAVDDQFIDNSKHNKHYNTVKFNSSKHQQFKDSPSRVINSGLATVPRNYNSNKTNTSATKTTTSTLITQHNKRAQPAKRAEENLNQSKSYQQDEPYSQFDTVYRSETYRPSTEFATPTREQQQYQQQQQQQPAAHVELMQTRDRLQLNQTQRNHTNHLSTLPNRKAQQHQLLQTHYRGNLLRDKTNTLPHPNSPRPSPVSSQGITSSIPSYGNQSAARANNNNNTAVQDKMRFTGYNNHGNNCAPSSHPSGAKSPIQQQLQASNTISGVPSATEVVRSALSRSGSQVSLNQLNKTINLLPNSPPAPSPMTPTQQLKAASPSLSPSPTRYHATSTPQQYSSKTLGHQPASQRQYLPGQVVVHGTRTIGRPPQQPATINQAQQQQQQQQQQHQVYANPHAAFMQHRMEQQMKQPNRNVSSIREFNELDSLLRSLNPGEARRTGVISPQTQTRTQNPSQLQAQTQAQTQITPGFSVKPAQPSFGGYMPANQQPQPTSTPKSNVGDVYARVQKPQPVGPGFSASSDNQAFTIDVTDKKFDENCRQKQREALSEFEPSIELVPSMEDYQNISKLNPVKNYYWYKPNMTRDRAIDLLKDKPQGTFIVRDSTSFRGAYGLAVKVSKLPKNILASLRNFNGDPSSEYVRHFLIEPTGAGVRLKGYANEPVFDSLPDLIYQHSLTELALPCRLIIPRADIEDERFNQKQKQFFDEFVASKEQAKHQPYERTSPDGGYRKYPGDVYVHNEHRIIFQ